MSQLLFEDAFVKLPFTSLSHTHAPGCDSLKRGKHCWNVG